MRAGLAVRYAYLALAVYALAVVSVTTLTLWHILPALLQLAIGYSLFLLGLRGSRPSATLRAAIPAGRGGNSRLWPVWSYLLVGVSAALAAGAAALYYTGKLPLEVVRYVLEGKSLYGSYQAFNSQLLAAGGGGGFSVAFALLVYLKCVLLLAVFSGIPQGRRLRRREIALLLLAVGAQAYLGLARGTGLEYFELGTMLAFAILIRPRNPRWSRWRSVATVLGLATALALLYVVILTARGATSSSLAAGGDVAVDPAGTGFVLGNPLVDLLLRFYDYFGFGFHYVSAYWSNIWLASPVSLLAGALPLGYVVLGIDPKVLIGGFITMGAHWHPDSVLIAADVGFVGLLAAFYLLGRLAKSLDRETSLTSSVLSYFVFLQMLALPVGNFVWVDTANLVVIAAVVCLRVLRTVAMPAPSQSVTAPPSDPDGSAPGTPPTPLPHGGHSPLKAYAARYLERGAS